MRENARFFPACGDLSESGQPVRYARRALFRAAVFGTPAASLAPAFATTAVSGVLTEVSQYSIAVSTRAGEEFLGISAATVTWLGARTTPTALRAGDPVIIRRQPAPFRVAGAASRDAAVAERIWARIGRVAGTIVAADGREFLVDTRQPGCPPERVVIAAPSLRQVQVRFPLLAPGYLIDVIGTRHRDYLLAVAPATAQPPRIAGHPHAPSQTGGRLASAFGGTAVWHEARGEPPGLLGLAYPALDPETDPAPDPGTGGRTAATAQDCIRLPYLSLGSMVHIRNECAGHVAALPVTGCATSARLFCDRCVQCGTSPRGRVADLTMAAFVELGGNLEDGCFNATLTLAD